MVTLQPKALEHVIELMVEGGLTPDTHNLRVGIKGGGCSGLSYTMDFGSFKYHRMIWVGYQY